MLSDNLVDPVQDGFDVTLRIADLGIVQSDRAKDHAHAEGDLRIARLSRKARHVHRTRGNSAITSR